MSRVTQLIGRSANARGSNSERIALAAAEMAVEQNEHLHAARAATPAEDRRGIDLVIDSDVGPLYLQVKDGRAAARVFSTMRRKAIIEVVTVRGSRDIETVLRSVVGALGRARCRVLERRNR